MRGLARDVLGYDDLRPGQGEAVVAVVAGRDTLAVLPTGSGKSAIYQLAALLLDGPTVVVSPLIALQRDQVRALLERGVDGAVAANSTMTDSHRQAVFDELHAGRVDFLFLAPEQLANPDTLEHLCRTRPALFVVDEAHCVSNWGHDFRPDYRRLADVIDALGHPPVLALTATASPPVRQDIVTSLGLHDPLVVVRGFDRPNIQLSARRFVDEEHKRRCLLDDVVAEDGQGLVYCATRRHAEDLATALLERGVMAGIYHAGLRPLDRKEVQRAFTSDELKVVVATTAFGMGIDKADVRFVNHYDVSDSLDSYYQEIGRAGRDGAPASSTLYFRPEDLGVRRFFASGAPAEEQIERVAHLLAAAGRAASLAELSEVTRLSETRLTAVLHLLEDLGVADLGSDGIVRRVGEWTADGVTTRARVLVESRRMVEQSRVDMMRAYAETDECRRRVLLSYFGEYSDQQCGNCDNCAKGRSPAVADGPFPLGSRVRHGEWGTGVVLRYEDDRVVVLFDGVGYKTLSLGAVIAGQLLEPVA